MDVGLFRYTAGSFTENTLKSTGGGQRKKESVAVNVKDRGRVRTHKKELILSR